MKANIIIEKDQYGYYAFCPEMKGCHSQGDSLDEVLKNIKEAIELYVETLSQEAKEAIGYIRKERSDLFYRFIKVKYCIPRLLKNFLKLQAILTKVIRGKTIWLAR